MSTQIFLKKDLYPPCLFGVCIMALCRFLKALWGSRDKIGEKIPSTPFYLQSLRDLKVITMLLLTGHYKASMAILRSSIENFLIGAYFDYKILTSESKKDIVENVRNYLETGKYNVPDEDYQKARKVCKDLSKDKFLWFNNLARYLKIEGILEENMYSEFVRLYKELNAYVHPKTFEDPNKGYPVWPAAVSIVREDYEKCIENVQRALVLEIELAWNLYCKRYDIVDKDEFIDSLKYIVKIEDFERHFGKKAVFVKRLKATIKEIKSKLS